MAGSSKSTVSLFDWFADRRKAAPVVRASQDTDEGDGLWSKCPDCGLVIYRKDLQANASVCKGCGYHHRIDSEESIRLIADRAASSRSIANSPPPTPSPSRIAQLRRSPARQPAQSTACGMRWSPASAGWRAIPWPWG